MQTYCRMGEDADLLRIGEYADHKMGEYANHRMGEYADHRMGEYADLLLEWQSMQTYCRMGE